jgi:phosphate acetyltransferase
MKLLEKIFQQAKNNLRCIVLPESLEERTLRAADIVLEQQIAHIQLIGNKERILEKANTLGLTHIDKARFFDPEKEAKMSTYIDLLYALRKEKGMTYEEASVLAKNPLYLSVLMIKNGDVDGELAGADNSTGNVLRPALQIVKTKPGVSVVSGVFFMVFDDTSIGEDGVLVFADCAVTPNPSAIQLAEIATVTAETTQLIGGFTPRVALLSFSTKGSAKHEMVDKVISATKLAQQLAPHICIDGELQLDAAIVPSVGASKAPNSLVKGNANVLIFPSLETGNIAYKLVQRLAGAEAVGPVLQGMGAPINDLSRGCSVDDIVRMIAITANQAR